MTDDLLAAAGGLLGLLGMTLGGYTLWRMNRHAHKVTTTAAAPDREQRGKRSFVIFWVAIGGAILSSVVVFLLLR